MDDTNMDVDELFGDSAIDQAMNQAMDQAMDQALDMPMSTPVKGLAQRLHELHTSGCSNLIAWSKTGCVAYVTPDGLSVKLAFLSCDPGDGTWSFKEDATRETPILAGNKHPITNLLWSSSLMDLAIADSSGRVIILNISYMALNYAQVTRPETDDPENDLNQPVGMYWLNKDRPGVWFLSSSKEHNWQFVPVRRMPFGPYHNFALALVTRSGNLRLLYQVPVVGWKTASASLQRMSSTEDMVTHATIAPMKEGSLILAMQTSDHKLHVYRVKIDFVQDKAQPEGVKLANLTVETIAGNVVTGAFKDPDVGLLGQEESSAYSALQLSHLEIIPTSDIEKTQPQQPVILAIYSSSVNAVGLPNTSHGSPAVICRWQLSVKEQKVHSVFDLIAQKSSDGKPKRKFDLNRLEDVPLPQVVTAVEHVEPGIIALSFGDGSIQMYESTSMADMQHQQEVGTVSSLAKAGYSFQPFQPEEGGLHWTISPNGCSVAMLDTNGKIHCKDMRFFPNLQSDQSPELEMETAVYALALTFGRACLTPQLTTDDILKLLMEQFPDQQTMFLEDLYRSLFPDQDFTSGVDALAKKTFIPKVFSMQAAFGYASTRTLSSSFTWSILNIRHVSWQFVQILTWLKQTTGVEFRDPDLLDTVISNIKYAHGLVGYIFNILFEIAQPTGSSLSTDLPHSDLVTLLLLSSWSRFFLRHLSRALRGMTTVPQSSSAVSPKALPAFIRIARVIDPTFGTSSSSQPSSSPSTTEEPPFPTKMEAVERLIVSTEKFIQSAYESAGLTTDAQRATIERSLLAHAVVPEVLKGVIPRVINEIIMPISRFEVHRLDVWKAEYRWLGLWRSARPNIDVHKKRRVRGLLNTNTTTNLDPNGPPPRPPVPPQQQQQQQQQQASLSASSSSKQQQPPPTSTINDQESSKPEPASSPPNNASSSSSSFSSSLSAETPQRKPKKRHRRCLRCAEVSEDILPGRGVPSYLRPQIGKCICEGYFGIEVS